MSVHTAVLAKGGLLARSIVITPLPEANIRRSERGLIVKPPVVASAQRGETHDMDCQVPSRKRPRGEKTPCQPVVPGQGSRPLAQDDLANARAKLVKQEPLVLSPADVLEIADAEMLREFNEALGEQPMQSSQFLEAAFPSTYSGMVSGFI